MVSKSGQRSEIVSREGEYKPALNFNIVNLLLNTNVERHRRPMLLFWSDSFVAGRVVSWEGGKGGRVVNWQGLKGGRVLRWQVGKGWRVVRWQVGKVGGVLRWQDRRFLVLFKDGGRRVSPRFHLCVSDVNRQS